MTPEQIAYWTGIFIGGFVIGAICGIPPLLLALRKGRRGFALGSWFGCVFSGLFLGLTLALIVSIILTVIAICMKKPEEDDVVSGSIEKQTEVSQ